MFSGCDCIVRPIHLFFVKDLSLYVSAWCLLFSLLDRLQDKKQEETDSKFFTKMPCDHYIEVTQLLLKRLEADSIFSFFNAPARVPMDILLSVKIRSPLFITILQIVNKSQKSYNYDLIDILLVNTNICFVKCIIILRTSNECKF